MTPNMARDLITAVHEAGHAVMARYFGRGPYDISIIPGEVDGRGIEGSCIIHVGLRSLGKKIQGKTWDAHQELEKNGLCLLGGPSAQNLFAMNFGGCNPDFNDALEIIRLLDPDAKQNSIYPYLTLCNLILSKPRTWGAVMDLAEALVDQRFIEGNEATTIIEKSTRLECVESFKGIK